MAGAQRVISPGDVSCLTGYDRSVACLLVSEATLDEGNDHLGAKFCFQGVGQMAMCSLIATFDCRKPVSVQEKHAMRGLRHSKRHRGRRALSTSCVNHRCRYCVQQGSATKNRQPPSGRGAATARFSPTHGWPRVSRPRELSHFAPIRGPLPRRRRPSEGASEVTCRR